MRLKDLILQLVGASPEPLERTEVVSRIGGDIKPIRQAIRELVESRELIVDQNMKLKLGAKR